MLTEDSSPGINSLLNFVEQKARSRLGHFIYLALFVFRLQTHFEYEEGLQFQVLAVATLDAEACGSHGNGLPGPVRACLLLQLYHGPSESI